MFSEKKETKFSPEYSAIEGLEIVCSIKSKIHLYDENIAQNLENVWAMLSGKRYHGAPKIVLFVTAIILHK